ncbi:Beta-lactamase domain-containing protein [Aspergillus sclerotialis]|uniref:Beta-lactamase domain-containing protein n=1 Tax=Aspergillus sclerotialis TaxID=2070753 RepID=A0A3A2ZKN9_9EURO|nr:Beta-lactamase domain-containing protein [Aspergillus sclerotialis]
MATNDRLSDISPSLADTADFVNADRGFIASRKPCLIKDSTGKSVWNNDEYNFVNEHPCPATVNPKLWRQAQLLSKQGLYRKAGIIAIDPLVSTECAKAALELYQSQRGVRSVKAIIYSHSHIDHYGGAAGVLPDSKIGPVVDDIHIIAPEGFMKEATSENVIAGPIMRHRAVYMYGSTLPRSPVGQIGVGLGMGTSQGKTSLIPPTIDIKHTGQTLTIDGVRIVFQMVPDTEAPAEVNMYFPDERALLVPECAVRCMHNITTLRGALVRDARAWSRYLDETLVLYCEKNRTDVLFGSHSWPAWGKEEVKGLLEDQRDLYAYLHDQTVRRMNDGWNGTEIAETMVLPARLRKAWHAQGYYGSVSHTVKGIYQRYMTWFDGYAENLWKLPPHEEGCRYIRCMGGVNEVLSKAKLFIEENDLRFAATLLGHVVAAGDQAGGPPALRAQGKTMLADVFERLGFGCENATWRNFYLGQALDLRRGDRPRNRFPSTSAKFPPSLSVEQWLSVLAIRIDGDQAGNEKRRICIDILVKDTQETWRLILSNGALTYRQQDDYTTGVESQLDLYMSVKKHELQRILTGKDVQEAQVLSGDIQALNSPFTGGHYGVEYEAKQPSLNSTLLLRSSHLNSKTVPVCYK